MLRQRVFYLLVIIFITSSSSIPHMTHSRGRKLFGGYRIAPKVCQPTNAGQTKADGPAICMFNGECSRRKGEVVGACMDGFLFGACCQLPAQQLADHLEKVSSSENQQPPYDVHEVDHVPDIPILLNPDGTPSVTSKSTSSPGQTTERPFTKDAYENAEKPQLPDYNQLENNFSSLLGAEHVLDDLKLPSLLAHSGSSNDIQQQYTSSAVNPVATLLNPNQIVQVADPVDQLPALFSHGIRNNTSKPEAETILLHKNGSAIREPNNPDAEFFKPTDSFTRHSTTATAQKLDSTERTTAAKKAITSPSYNYQEKSSSTGQSSQYFKSTSATKAATMPMMASKEKHSSATFLTTTPLTLSTRTKDDLVRVPTINYAGQSGNKKHDDIDKEEIAINHIISILNDTNEAKVTTGQVTRNPTTYSTFDTSSNPTLFKIVTAHSSSPSLAAAVVAETTESLPPTIYSGVSSPNYYHYNTEGLSSSRYPTTDSYSTQSAYSSRPTTNPPAPTVIVLGPLGTEYTTLPTQSTPSYQSTSSHQKHTSGQKPYGSPIRPTLATKKPSVATTLTHNISTVISGNKQVLSVSYISVDLKDGTTLKPTSQKDEADSNKLVTKRPSTIYTTLTSWSEKPSFHLKPSTPNFQWPSDNSDNYHKITRPANGYTTLGTNCEDETAPSDDLNNFPPVRHPDLDSTINHMQEKPTFVEPIEIISEDEIPTPDFVEDAELNNKVDVFVNKIVESLKDDFQNLKNVVYNPKNVTTVNLPAGSGSATKKPQVATTRKPTSKPTVKATRKPLVTRLTTLASSSAVTQKIPASTKPRPSSASTKKPSTTKRAKPLKKISTTTPSGDTFDAEATTPAKPAEATTSIPEITPNADFRSICGIRPLVKTGRIVGGKGATFGEWPWQVLVREATWLGLFTKNKCGGVLISDKYVITAAHCQPGFLASLVAVFGEFDLSGELESKRSVTRNVRRVIVNRAYDPATFENDLALLELESPIQFDSHIVPICMPDDNTDYVNRMATVTGWGRLKYNGGVPSVLQEVKVPIMENSVCQEMFQTAGHSKLILESFMCAGYANGQKDSCEGDSGGPLTLQREDGRWILVGTVSHGIKCAAPYLPGVYMRTTYFKPWLHSITGV